MSTRIQPFGQRSGFGASTGVGPMGEFVSALLRATTPEQLARLALAQIEARFGCRAVRVVWQLSLGADSASQRHGLPELPSANPEAALIEAAFAARADVQAGVPDSEMLRIASVFVSGGTSACAVLLTEWPTAAAHAQAGLDWHEGMILLGTRFADVLERAEQGLAIERLDKAARLQRALYAIADLAGTDLDMAEMLPRVHAVVAELMYAENMLIALYNAERDSVRFVYFADKRDPREVDPEEEYPTERIQGSLTLAVIRHARSAMGPSLRVRAEFGLISDPSVYGPESSDWLGVPMLAEGKACGAIVVQSYDADTRYQEADRALLGFVAQHILTALLRKQAYEELERRVEQRTHELTVQVHERQRGERLQAALYAIADLASSELDMREMLRRVHRVVGALMYARNFFIALHHGQRHTLQFIYFADEKDEGMYDPEVEIPVADMGNSLTLGLVRHGQPVRGTAHEVADVLQVPGGVGLGTPATHFLGVPMVVNGDVRGVVVVQTYDPAVHYDEEDSALLSYVAQHILTALARKQAKDELELRVRDRTRELQAEVHERQRGEKLQAALFQIADLASADLDMSEMLPRLHRVVGELMFAENFFITLFRPERDTMQFIYFADTRDSSVVDTNAELPVANIRGSLALEVIRRGRSIMGPSAKLRQDFGFGPALDYGPDAADWLGVPMGPEGQVLGAVVVQSYDLANRYSEEDRALLAFVAQHILTALMRKQAYEELERRVDERTHELKREVQERQRGERLQAALYAIADLASGELDMTEVLRRIHSVVGELMYARNFFIALYSPERDTLRFIYHADEKDPGMVDPTEEIPAERLSQSLTLGLIRYGRPVMGPSRDVRERLSVPGSTTVGTPAKDFLGVPMMADGLVRGVVVVQSYDESVQYTDDDSALLGYVAQHILTALSRKQAQSELERRVQDRTQELADAVRELREQIGERERIEKQLVYENLHDALTGLPNRGFLLDALSRALARSRRDAAHRFAVLFLDLDRFKVVNDSVGHLVGDELLKEAAQRLAGCVRSPDMVARLGGDEFALLLEDVKSPDDVFHVAQRVIATISEPMRIAGKELFPSASVGIALSHERYKSAEELLRDADVAMYRAKAKGRQRFEVFDEGLHQEALRLLDLEGDLRRALLRSEFEPHFQPIVRLSDGRTVGWEALLRWRHPERGLLLPADFLSVAEESGSAEQIDWQMFDKTCRAIPELFDDVGYVTLNVSARHFRSPDLAQQFLDMLASHSVPPRCVRLEMTEGALFENPDQARSTLETLREAGVLAALDDFGTGYSSLSYLHRFPLHALKIDRSFVADLKPGGGGSAAVVRAVLALASTLGMEVVAEGIETTAQRELLIELGCDFGQGFLFAQPRPAGKWETPHS